MTLTVLADFSGMSVGMLSMIETGERSLSSYRHVMGLASALRVQPSEIIPGLAGLAAQDTDTHSHPADMPPVISGLEQWLVTGYLNPTPEAHETKDLERDLRAVFAAYQASRFTTAADRVTDLLGRAEFTARECRETTRPRALRTLALSYQAASATLVKAGVPDLGWIAAERGLNAAMTAGNPVVIGSLIRSVAFSMLAAGRPDASMRLVESGADSLRGMISGDDRALSVFGTLFLAGAMAASRSGDRVRTADYLREADVAAQRLGRDDNHLWTAFGPTNVAIHQVNTAVELGDIQAVLDTGLTVDTAALPTERQVRYLLDVARVHTLTGRHDDALGTMLAAEKIAPEQVCQHHVSRKVVGHLVRTTRGKPSAPLARLARRLSNGGAPR